jgi:hypothetical protein
MRPSTLGLVSGLLLLCAVAGPVRAWGGPGHRVVADLAQARLRPAAQAEVARLLAGEPATRLADVATWEDDLREAGGPLASATRHWHFVNFDGGCDYVPPRDCRGGDGDIAPIDREFAILADHGQPDGERREALKFLVHLVGDVHQPLHATPIADKGGGDYQLFWHGKGRNLHGVWDGLLLDHALHADGLPDADAYAARLLAAPPLAPDPSLLPDPPASPDPAVRAGPAVVAWALESCRLVRDGGLYPPGHELQDAYLDAHRAQMDLQLRRAGERLGDLLNRALDPPASASAH